MASTWRVVVVALQPLLNVERVMWYVVAVSKLVCVSKESSRAGVVSFTDRELRTKLGQICLQCHLYSLLAQCRVNSL